MSRHERLVQLALELVDGRPVRVDQCMERFGITRRTFIRDVRLLRSSGLQVVFRKAHGDFVARAAREPAEVSSMRGDILLYGLWSSPLMTDALARETVLRAFCATTGATHADLPPHRYDGMPPTAELRRAWSRWKCSASRPAAPRSFATVVQAMRDRKLVHFAMNRGASRRLAWWRFEPRTFIVGRPDILVEGRWIDRVPAPDSHVPLDVPTAVVAADL